MKVKFYRLSYYELRYALKKVASLYKIEILKEITILDDYVFLCRYNGKRLKVSSSEPK